MEERIPQAAGYAKRKTTAQGAHRADLCTMNRHGLGLSGGKRKLIDE
jgi:hypothetical protein